MRAPIPETTAPLAWRRIGIRQFRMVSGLILFGYVLSHFLNHALGNISLEAMAQGLLWHLWVWTSLPGTVALYGAAAVHIALGLHALYERRRLGWRAAEPAQLVLGLSIPLLVIGHVVSIRLGEAIYMHEKLYPQAFWAYWVASPSQGWWMILAVGVSWIHACIGLYFWLRLRDWYAAAAPWLLAIAVTVPMLSLLGLYQGGHRIVALSADGAWQAQNLSAAKIGTAAQQTTLQAVTDNLTLIYLALIAMALLARGVRMLIERRRGTVRLTYASGRTLRVPLGLSVLEAAQRHNVPHASACGGRARCSTCRIRVIGDCTALPLPSGREAAVLMRSGTAGDPAVRLACQLRPTHDLVFVPLFPPATRTAALRRPRRTGQERYLVSMFVDMRGSTELAETLLPFDTVFIVNRFLGAVARAVVAAGGTPNQFVGDGQLALFGLDCDPQTACRQALTAAAGIAANIDDLNRTLAHDRRKPIGFGIGIHGGDVIVGDIGYRDHVVFTALGDAVNVAARLQDMTKTLGCEAIVSDDVWTTAGQGGDLPAQTLAIRGRSAPMAVRYALKARDLAEPNVALGVA